VGLGEGYDIIRSYLASGGGEMFVARENTPKSRAPEGSGMFNGFLFFLLNWYDSSVRV